MRTRRSRKENDTLLLPDVTKSPVERNSQRLIIRTRENNSSNKRVTWRTYAATIGKHSKTNDFVELDRYLREGKSSTKTKMISAESSAASKDVENANSLYRGNVVMALNDIDKAEVAADILREALFNVYFFQDGRALLNFVADKSEIKSSMRIDCIVVERHLNLADAFEVTKRVREFEKGLRQKESAQLALGGSGHPPQGSRISMICCTDDTTPEALRSFMKADMDGCLNLPVDRIALLNTVKAAVPHHLALLKNKSPEKQRVFRVGPLGIKEGGNDSSASAYKGLSTSKSKEDDIAFNGLAQLDADTLLPFIVMDASRNAQVQIKNRGSVFSLVVCHDLFDTAERLKIFFKPIVTKYPGLQVLLWNYPGQAFTEWRSDQLLNNEYHAICLNELLGQIGHLGTSDFDTSHPFYILGYGHGMSVAAFYAAHYNVPNLRGVISVNGWSYLDSYIAGVMHDAINIFECAPPSRPDLPVYFFSRFLFSRDYLAKASVPLALNIYTAVHNPISIKGRVSLCRGVLQQKDTRPVLNEIDRPLICIQSTQNAFVRPLHTEPFVSSRGGEVDSVYHVLLEPTKTCVVWLKAGHEVFQEKRTELLLLIEQILTGYHDTHNVLVTRVDKVDTFDAIDPDGHRAMLNKEILSSSVEDRFIANFLKNMTKIEAEADRNKATTSALQQISMGHDRNILPKSHMSDLMTPSSASRAVPPQQLGRFGSRISKATPVTDPNIWLEYSKRMTETNSLPHENEKNRYDRPIEAERLLVLDPTSVLFDRQDTINRTKSQQMLTNQANAVDFPEVKEYMAWRLKRNKRRLQRLQSAARIIQCAFRCYMARQRVSFIRRSRAVLNIQR